jgi:hypothetical protein
MQGLGLDSHFEKNMHGMELLRTIGQSTATINLVWAKLWSLKVSAKVKVFAWRLLYGNIPCNCVLTNRHNTY